MIWAVGPEAKENWIREHRADLSQAARVALIVGPFLVVINNLDVLSAGRLPAHFGLKVVLTFVVPFLVSLYSSVARGHRRTPPAEGA